MIKTANAFKLNLFAIIGGKYRIPLFRTIIQLTFNYFLYIMSYGILVRIDVVYNA